MITKHRHELRHARKAWAGTLADPCLLSGLALHENTFIRTEAEKLNIICKEKKSSCKETTSKISLPALFIIEPLNFLRILIRNHSKITKSVGQPLLHTAMRIRIRRATILEGFFDCSDTRKSCLQEKQTVTVIHRIKYAATVCGLQCSEVTLI